MSHESKVALERIVTLCEKSTNLSMRQLRIYDIALEGLGYVASQRKAMTDKWRQPLEERVRARVERKRALLEQQEAA